MPERSGRWDLLGVDGDPVVVDVPAIDERVEYFRSLANAMREQSGRLARIGSGDSLRGEYADELRETAGAVAKDLSRVVGRYEAAVQGLMVFRPAVDAALVGSAAALEDAMDAAGDARRADALPEAAAATGEELTAQEVEQNAARDAAVAAAAGRLSAAKARLDGVLARFDEAGREAAGLVRSGFRDGLTDSWIDKLVAFFKKFVKIVIEVLTYIGIALAVVAMIIPGVGPLLMAGAVLGAVAVVAEFALIAMGEGSWLDLGIALAGTLTLGVAKVAAPAIRSGFRGAMQSLRGTRATPTSSIPAPARAPSPVPERVPSPVPERVPSPVPERVPSPVAERVPSPVPERVPSPAVTPRPAPKGVWRPRRRARPTEELPPDLNKLDPDEILSPEDAALQRLLGGGASRMNPHLRNPPAIPDAAMDAEAELMSRGLRKIRPLDHAITYRGVNIDLTQNLRPAGSFSDPAFVSTSLDREVAESFVRTGGNLNGINTSGVGTLLRFDTRNAGRDVRHLTTTGESEVLFDRNTVLEVVEVRRNASQIPDGRGGLVTVHEVDLRTPRVVSGDGASER